MAAFCSQCGAAVGQGARFCQACGVAVQDAPAGGAWQWANQWTGQGTGQWAHQWFNPVRPLYRARFGSQVGGICQGLANSYGWDVAVVRVVAILLGIFAFPLGEVAYLAAWIGIPEEPLSVGPIAPPEQPY